MKKLIQWAQFIAWAILAFLLLVALCSWVIETAFMFGRKAYCEPLTEIKGKEKDSNRILTTELNKVVYECEK